MKSRTQRPDATETDSRSDRGGELPPQANAGRRGLGSGAAEALRHRPFAVYATGQAVSQIGTWTQHVAVGWLAWTLSESEAWLGIAAFGQFAPAIIVGPLAGSLADRHDRVRLAMAGLSAAALLAVLLFALTAAGSLTLFALLACLVGFGTATSVSLPSMRAVVSTLVPADSLAAAISINAITLNGARFVGPACAGLLIHARFVELCFLLNAVSFAVLLVSLAWVRRRVAASGQASPHRRRDDPLTFRAGFRYAAGHAVIRTTLVVYLVYALLARPVIDLLPAIVGGVYLGDSALLALFTTAIGAGAIAAGIGLMLMKGNAALSRFPAGAAIVLGGSIAALFLTPSIAVATAAMAVFGAAQVTMNVATQTRVQLAADDRYRGRVMAMHFMMFRGGAAIGGLALGALAEWLGIVAVFAAAAATLLVMGLAGLRDKTA